MSFVLTALIVLLSTLFLPSAFADLVIMGLFGFALLISLFCRRLGLAISLGLVIGAVHYSQWSAQRLPSHCLSESLNIQAKVIDFPTIFEAIGEGFIAKLTLEVLSQEASACRVSAKLIGYLPLADRDSGPLLGTKLALTGRLKPTASQLSPHVWPDQARALGYQRSASLRIDSIEYETSDAASSGESVRHDLADWIDQTLTDAAAVALTQALLIGRLDVLSDENWRLFKRLGIAHVVVVSGLHIGLVSVFVWGLMHWPRRILRIPADTGGSWPICVVVILICIGYALLSGWGLPAQRATFMIAALTLFRASGLSVSPLHLLLVIAFLMLSVDVFAALTPSFWLSFGITAVILTFLASTSAFPMLTRVVAIQLLATLAGAVLTTVFFGELSLASLISNWIAVPMLAWWCLPLGLAAIGAELLSFGFSSWLLRMASMPMPLFLQLAEALDVATAPFLFHRVTFHWGLALFLLLPLVGVVGRATRFLSLFCVFALTLNRDTEDRLSYQLFIVDVGQGTAIVLIARQLTALFDVGGFANPQLSQVTKVLAPLLSAHGRKTIDHLWVSHGDIDHSGGISDLLERFHVQHWYGFGGTQCRAGQQIRLASHATLTVISGSGHSNKRRNADSCAILLSLYGTKILIPGDIDADTERDIVAYWGPNSLDVEVLIAAHHGSNTSTSATWLQATKPERLLYSSGAYNRFGHPHEAVEQRVEQLDIPSWNTAESGTLGLIIDFQGMSKVTEMRTRSSPYWLQLPF